MFLGRVRNKHWPKVTYRSSHPEVFCKKGVLRNFAKFTGKHLCQSLFLNKVVGLRRATLLRKRLWHRCFPKNFAKFLRTPFIIEHVWWLLLDLTSEPVSRQCSPSFQCFSVICSNTCKIQKRIDLTGKTSVI